MAMLGTVPIDLVQYYYHLVVTAQKLAYVYGWPELDGKSQGDFPIMVTFFTGMMTGIVNADTEIKALSKELEKESLKKLSYVILAKAGILLAAKYAAGILSSKLFWQGYIRTSAKVVPLLGGLASGGVTMATFLLMANTLKRELSKNIIR
jgi:hypothetical protein